MFVKRFYDALYDSRALSIPCSYRSLPLRQTFLLNKKTFLFIIVASSPTTHDWDDTQSSSLLNVLCSRISSQRDLTTTNFTYTRYEWASHNPEIICIHQRRRWVKKGVESKVYRKVSKVSTWGRLEGANKLLSWSWRWGVWEIMIKNENEKLRATNNNNSKFFTTHEEGNFCVSSKKQSQIVADMGNEAQATQFFISSFR